MLWDNNLRHSKIPTFTPRDITIDLLERKLKECYNVFSMTVTDNEITFIFCDF